MTGSWPGTQPAIRPGWPVNPRTRFAGRGVFGQGVGSGRQAPDLVERDFTAENPDQLWVADITYVPTAVGFLYLAVVLDACSRRIVGWAMGTRLLT